MEITVEITMKYLDAKENGSVLVGVAYGPLLYHMLEAYPTLVDYVELSFEQLRHARETARVQDRLPAILHCASMSLAGFVPPSEDTLSAILSEASRMQTPWIGEHLAFISADSLGVSEPGEMNNGHTTPLSYTVSPQCSEQTVDRVIQNIEALKARFPMPIILENSPQYFEIPGSTMSMAEFVTRIAETCDIDLLLDLTHFTITCINTGMVPREELLRLPLERVIEVHMSGISVQSGIAWDDHASPAPEEIFELLPLVMERSPVRALTLEYNWSPNLPLEIVRRQMLRTRQILAV